ncbi:Heparinase II III family protein, partial [Rhizoctonia solani]
MAGHYDDSGQRHSDVRYQEAYNPYGSGDPYYNGSQAAFGNMPEKKKTGTSPWVKFGIPVLIAVIIAAVVGGVVGSRNSKSDNAATSGNSGTGSGGGKNGSPAAESSAASVKNAIGRFATATDSMSNPIYPSTTNAAAFTAPTFGASGNSALSWPVDSFKPSNPSATSVRPDRPRIVAPAYKWEALPALIKTDPYLKGWNETIFSNAQTYYDQPVKAYFMDGGNGILDIAREIKVRIKAWCYAYRMSKDTKWVDRTWRELENAAGNTTAGFGPASDHWNTMHFLDVAELTNAFGIGYDWMYDAWTADQRNAIMWTIINVGLSAGVASYNDPTSHGNFGWWQNGINGNWNCVCNGGLTVGALAILGDDPTGTAETMLGLTIPNAQQNCAFGPSSDGTWSETPNYWYFGTTGHAEMSSALLTATGSTYDLPVPDYNLTALYHMHVYGPVAKFDYGDTGPNKFSATANSMMFYGSYFNEPRYTLFQRDRADAAEPWSMFWYDPSVSGAFWDGMPLDHYFDNGLDQWAAMRTSWTDNNALYAAIKSGNHTGHQTHGDLDAGTFVLDAMGQRWAGELGNGDYLSTGYFQNEKQDSQRWLYYRKRTEGQNTLVVNNDNQNVNAQPTVQYGSTLDKQGSSTVYDVGSGSTAFFTTDLTTTYNGQNIKRGMRLINGRKQVLLQDDLSNVSQSVEWRMHTNATVTIDSAGTTATLELGGQKMEVKLLNAGQGVVFSTKEAVRASTDPAFPPGQTDQPNPGVTVLCITLATGGTQSLQVLFNPQWSGMSASDFKTPANVPLDQCVFLSGLRFVLYHSIRRLALPVFLPVCAMAASTPEDHSREWHFIKRQGCHNATPISTRYETSTVTSHHVSYLYYTSTSHSSDPPETTKPTSTSRTHYTFTFEPRPPISIETRTSTTLLPPKKSVVSTTSDIIPRARAVHGTPITITQTHITKIPVETIYSCPPTSHEPATSTSWSTDPTSHSSRELPTSWLEPTSRSGWEPPSSSTYSTSRLTIATDPAPPSTSDEPATTSRGPWHPSPPVSSVATSRSRPTSTVAPLTSPPPSSNTQSTSTILSSTSSAPNSTITPAPWPPTATRSYSEYVYTLFDGTYPYSSYTARCSPTTSESLCTSFYRNGEWDLVLCTSGSTNTTSTTSTLTNVTTSTRTITSWPCSSYATELQQWVPVSCSSTAPNITTSSPGGCSSFMDPRSGWTIVPCTSTPNITSVSPTITMPPTVTITPTRTHSRSCSTHDQDLRTWIPVPCDPSTNTSTIATIPDSTPTRNTTTISTITSVFNITKTPTITTRPTASQTQHCSTYLPWLELWVSAPCVTATPTSMCLDDSQDIWVPCTSVARTSGTDTWTLISEVTGNSSPMTATTTRHPHTFHPTTSFTETDEPTSTDDTTLTDKHTYTREIQTHTPTRTPLTSTSDANIETSEVHSSHLTYTSAPPTSQTSPGTSFEIESSSIQETTTFRGPTDPGLPRPTSPRPTQSPTSTVLFTSNFIVPSTQGIFFPSPTSTLTPAPDGIRSGTLAGIIVGSILGVVGLLGIGAFMIKSFGGYRGHDIFEPRGGYQAAPGGGSAGGRDGGSSGIEAGGSSGMAEIRNEAPLRSALRNRGEVGGGWNDASWGPAYAYTGVATAAAVAAATSSNQRGRDPGSDGRYADGGIRDEDTPDAVPQRYGDGGLAGPDSHYDTEMNDRDHGYESRDIRYIVSNSEVQFDPYRDLPNGQDSVPIGNNLTRQSALTGPGISLDLAGGTQPYHSTPAVSEHYPPASLQPDQTDSGVFMSGSNGQSTTSFAPSTMDPFPQPHPDYTHQISPPYVEYGGTGGVAHQSPQPFMSTDIQRPPYWENSAPVASVDSLPMHSNIPRYSALMGADNVTGTGGSSAPGSNNTPGVGSPSAPALGIASMAGIEGTSHVEGSGLANPTWDLPGVAEFGQHAADPPGPQINESACIAGSAVPDAPRGLHQGLNQRDNVVSSPVSASGVGMRPPKVGGPRARPQRSLPPGESMTRLDSRRSLPPAYEE